MEKNKNICFLEVLPEDKKLVASTFPEAVIFPEALPEDVRISHQHY